MKTDNLVKSLNEFGIRAAAYKRPPVAADVFALTILPRHEEGVITLNQGTASVRVFGDKSRRQAAVTVREKPRIVTKNVKVRTRRENPPDEIEQHRQLRVNFPISMPEGTVFSYEDVGVKRIKEANVNIAPGNRLWEMSGKVTAKVGKSTTNHFLMGMDETHHFIAPLPKAAKSVEDAHRILRPKVKPSSLRQGEWFFEPCSAFMSKRIEGIVEKVPLMVHRQQLGNSTHFALSGVRLLHTVKGREGRVAVIYARGYISDNRPGHHTMLHLPSWHKAVKNKEVEIKGSEQSKRRQRTFD